MYAHGGAFEQWRQREELIVNHLDVRDHVQGVEVGQQRTGVGVVLDGEQGGVERDARTPAAFRAASSARGMSLGTTAIPR
jgi:hypothetical protein